MEDRCQIDFIVKLGGSAVTFKTQFESVKMDDIKNVGNVLLMAWKKGVKFIVVHGAGSFGHFQAKEYQVKNGWINKQFKEESKIRRGFCLTRISVCKLNQMIVSEMCSIGLPAVALNTACSWTSNNMEIESHGCDVINKCLLEGFIPVLHGDAILDSSQGCTILSGDTIIKFLCQQFKPTCVLFLSDVDGLYNKPPHTEGAELISNVKVGRHGQIQTSVAFSRLCQDVTGGIEEKISTAIDIIQQSKGFINVVICGIALIKSVENVCCYGELKGERGTLIEIDEHDKALESSPVRFY